MPHKESKEEIARRLHITRLALGFETQAGFAETLDGVTPQRWNNYEAGRDRLTLNLALTICHKFPQVTLDWLFRGDKSSLRPAVSTAIDDAERVIGRVRR
jgi:DNA-binding XRE family transcriptional regulator